LKIQQQTNRVFTIHNWDPITQAMESISAVLGSGFCISKNQYETKKVVIWINFSFSLRFVHHFIVKKIVVENNWVSLLYQLPNSQYTVLFPESATLLKYIFIVSINCFCFRIKYFKKNFIIEISKKLIWTNYSSAMLVAWLI